MNNFGMGMGRADIRQKSYTNLRAITVILEDLKLDQDVSNSIIFTQFLKEKTFAELEEKEKICLLEELLNNSTNSNSTLNLIQYKFQTGYY